MKKSISDIIQFTLFLYALFSIISITISEIFFIVSILLFFIDIYINKKDIKNYLSNSLTIPIFAFIAIHFLSGFFGISPRDSLKDARKVYLFSMFFLCFYYLNKPEKVKMAFDFFTIGAAFVGLYAIVTGVYFKYIKGISDFRATSFSGNHMHAGGMLMIALIVIFSLFIYSIKNNGTKFKKLFYFFSLILVFFGLLFTYTRSSYIAGFIGILIVLFFIDKKWFIFALLGILLVFILTINTSFTQRLIRTYTFFSGDSGRERILMWQSGFKIIRDHPIFGIGTANLDKIYPKYINPEAKEKNQGHLHNNILQIAVIDGIPGLIIFLWIFSVIFINLFRFYTISNEIFAKYTLLSLFSVSVAFFINGLFEYNFFSSQVVLIFWFLMGIGFGIGKETMQ
jgi:O-antigen ligase